MTLRLIAIALLLLAAMQPGRADQGSYESTMIIQTGLSRTGDYDGTVDGRCGPETFNAAMRYIERTKSGDGLPMKGEWADDFCSDTPSAYFLYFKGRQDFDLEAELGFAILRGSEFEEIIRDCGGWWSPEIFGDGLKSAVLHFFTSIVIVESPDDTADEKKAVKQLRCYTDRLGTP
jgi:hypothetical protein